MAIAAGSFTHMPVLPTLKYASKKSMTITIKCANNKNKTKVYAMKPIVRPGGGLGTDPQSTINRRPIGEPTGSTGSEDLGTDPQSTIDSHDGEPTGSTGSEGLGTDPQMENPQLPTNPPKNSDDDEDQLDNTSAFNLTGNE
ncbi:uncharacterized protein [Medicago truncatula]|uniref:uncharacterized protein isoform X1 n=1 Tax=Medicago truncatula TaxID=3880 RepID=UPI000D2F2466|nr:uncharacterized protein LOC11410404 isoform X1 [Medicago truncatula]